MLFVSIRFVINFIMIERTNFVVIKLFIVFYILKDAGFYFYTHFLNTYALSMVNSLV